MTPLRRGSNFGWALALGFAAFAALGCNRMRVDVAPVATSVQRPSNVAVYLSVSDQGQPVTTLDASNFTLLEDGQKLDPKSVSLTLLPRDAAVEHRVLLLLDLTGAPSPGERHLLAQAAASFVRKVRAAEAVDVYAFDGANGVRQVKQFPREWTGSQPTSFDELEQIPSKDRSRDLHGAIIDALAHLDSTLASSEKPVRVGTLVVFTSGGDLAGRVGVDRVKTELARTPDRVIAIGIGHDGKLSLATLGRSGVFRSASLDDIAQAFDHAADRALAIENGHYLVSYCSPARSGVRELEIQITTAGEKGQIKNGSAKLGFSAEGFAGSCNTNDAPRFVVTLVSVRGKAVPGIARDEPPPAPPPEATPPPEQSQTATEEADGAKEHADDGQAEPKGKEAKAGKTKPKRARGKRVTEARTPSAAKTPATKPAEATKPAAAETKPAPPPAKPPREKGEEKEEPDFNP